MNEKVNIYIKNNIWKNAFHYPLNKHVFWAWAMGGWGALFSQHWIFFLNYEFCENFKKVEKENNFFETIGIFKACWGQDYTPAPITMSNYGLGCTCLQLLNFMKPMPRGFVLPLHFQYSFYFLKFFRRLRIGQAVFREYTLGFILQNPTKKISRNYWIM